METVVIPLPFQHVDWPLAPLHAHMSPGCVLDPAPALEAAAATLASGVTGAQLHLRSASNDNGLVAIVMGPTPESVDCLRTKVIDAFEPPEEAVLDLDSACIVDAVGCLDSGLTKALDALADHCGVGIAVVESRAALQLHILGQRSRVRYTRYRALVLLNHIYGYKIMRVDVALSKQALLSGPDRQHLHTVFQQTGVNVYMPPSGWGLVAPPPVNVDEIWLAGDEAQVLVAYKLVREILIGRLDLVAKDVPITHSAADWLRLHCSAAIEDIMVRNSTFIHAVEPSGNIPHSNILRIQGTTRNSVERTVDAIMALCSNLLEAEAELVSPLDTSPVEAAIYTAALPGASAIVALSADGKRATVTGGGDATPPALQALSPKRVRLAVEAPVALKEFVVGKKQGKVARITGPTGTQMILEAPHNEYNFRICIQGAPDQVISAMNQLRDELPAEKWLYVPEAWHKQVIGAGGQRIQTLMRRHNVYMRFSNCVGAHFRFPNAFGSLRVDNVVIRCPAKNSASIDAAAAELQNDVAAMAAEYERSYVRLTRNHRRLLLAGNSNALAEIELATHAAIMLPPYESRETQMVEIGGLSSTQRAEAAARLQELLPDRDYEFRVPWSVRFAEVVGPNSDFALRVAVPLLMGLDAQVQAFERVQMQGDPALYSQIVVSLAGGTNESESSEVIDEISHIVTSYLREHDLDIVDKGELRSESGIGSAGPPPPVRLWSTPFVPLQTQQTLKLNYNDTPVRRRAIHRY